MLLYTGCFLDLTRKTQPPLAEASVANIETGFIESNVDFTTASGLAGATEHKVRLGAGEVRASGNARAVKLR